MRSARPRDSTHLISIMKLHLPTGLRKALLACLAAIAGRRVLRRTVASGTALLGAFSVLWSTPPAQADEEPPLAAPAGDELVLGTEGKDEEEEQDLLAANSAGDIMMLAATEGVIPLASGNALTWSGTGDFNLTPSTDDNRTWSEQNQSLADRIVVLAGTVSSDKDTVNVTVTSDDGSVSMAELMVGKSGNEVDTTKYVFKAGSAAQTLTVDDALTFRAGDVTFGSTEGNALSLSAGSIVISSGNVTFQGAGTFDVTGTLTLGSGAGVVIGEDSILTVGGLDGSGGDAYGTIAGQGTLKLTAASGSYAGSIGSGFEFAGTNSNSTYTLAGSFSGSHLAVSQGKLQLQIAGDDNGEVDLGGVILNVSAGSLEFLNAAGVTGTVANGGTRYIVGGLTGNGTGLIGAPSNVFTTLVIDYSGEEKLTAEVNLIGTDGSTYYMSLEKKGTGTQEIAGIKDGTKLFHVFSLAVTGGTLETTVETLETCGVVKVGNDDGNEAHLIAKNWTASNYNGAGSAITVGQGGTIELSGNLTSSVAIAVNQGGTIKLNGNLTSNVAITVGGEVSVGEALNGGTSGYTGAIVVNGGTLKVGERHKGEGQTTGRGSLNDAWVHSLAVHGGEVNIAGSLVVQLNGGNAAITVDNGGQLIIGGQIANTFNYYNKTGNITVGATDSKGTLKADMMVNAEQITVQYAESSMTAMNGLNATSLSVTSGGTATLTGALTITRGISVSGTGSKLALGGAVTVNGEQTWTIGAGSVFEATAEDVSLAIGASGGSLTLSVDATASGGKLKLSDAALTALTGLKLTLTGLEDQEGGWTCQLFDVAAMSSQDKGSRLTQFVREVLQGYLARDLSVSDEGYLTYNSALAGAHELTWGNGTETWQSGGGGWNDSSSGGGAGVFENGDNVTFASADGETHIVTIEGAVNPGKMQVTSGTWTFSGGDLSVTGSLTIGTDDSGSDVTFSGTGALAIGSGVTVKGQSSMTLDKIVNVGLGSVTVEAEGEFVTANHGTFCNYTTSWGAVSGAGSVVLKDLGGNFTLTGAYTAGGGENNNDRTKGLYGMLSGSTGIGSIILRGNSVIATCTGDADGVFGKVTDSVVVEAGASLWLYRVDNPLGNREKDEHARTLYLCGDGGEGHAAALRSANIAHSIAWDVSLEKSTDGATIQTDSNLTFSGGLDFSGKTLTKTGANELKLTGAVMGGGGTIDVKNGSITLACTQVSNTLQNIDINLCGSIVGETAVTGALNVNESAAIGALYGSGTVTIATSKTLTLTKANDETTHPFAGSITGAGTLVLSNDVTFAVNGTEASISSALTGTGTLKLTGGTLTLGEGFSTSGKSLKINVAGGTLVLGYASTVDTNYLSDVTLQVDGNLYFTGAADVANTTYVVGGLEGTTSSSDVKLRTGESAKLIIDYSGEKELSFAGQFSDQSVNPGKKVDLVKRGSGTQILTTGHLDTKSTTVEAGTLEFKNAGTTWSPFTVESEGIANFKGGWTFHNGSSLTVHGGTVTVTGKLGITDPDTEAVLTIDNGGSVTAGSLGGTGTGHAGRLKVGGADTSGKLTVGTEASSYTGDAFKAKSLYVQNSANDAGEGSVVTIYGNVNFYNFVSGQNGYAMIIDGKSKVIIDGTLHGDSSAHDLQSVKLDNGGELGVKGAVTFGDNYGLEVVNGSATLSGGVTASSITMSQGSLTLGGALNITNEVTVSGGKMKLASADLSSHSLAIELTGTLEIAAADSGNVLTFGDDQKLTLTIHTTSQTEGGKLRLTNEVMTALKDLANKIEIQLAGTQSGANWTYKLFDVTGLDTAWTNTTAQEFLQALWDEGSVSVTNEGIVQFSQGKQLTWTGGDDGLWDTSSQNWESTSTYASGDSVTFGEKGSSAHSSVTVVGNLTPGDIHVTGSSTYTFTGQETNSASIAASGNLYVEGDSSATFGDLSSFSVAGGEIIGSLKLESTVTGTKSLGSMTVGSNGTITITDCTASNWNGTTISGDGTVVLGASGIDGHTVTVDETNNLFTALFARGDTTIQRNNDHEGIGRFEIANGTTLTFSGNAQTIGKGLSFARCLVVKDGASLQVNSSVFDWGNANSIKYNEHGTLVLEGSGIEEQTGALVVTAEEWMKWDVELANDATIYVKNVTLHFAGAGDYAGSFDGKDHKLTIKGSGNNSQLKIDENFQMHGTIGGEIEIGEEATLWLATSSSLDMGTYGVILDGGVLKMSQSAQIKSLSGRGGVNFAGGHVLTIVGNGAKAYTGTITNYSGSKVTVNGGADFLLGNGASVNTTLEVSGTLSTEAGTEDDNLVTATVNVLNVGNDGQVKLGDHSTLTVTTLGGVSGQYGSITGGGTLKLTGNGGSFSGSVASNLEYAGSRDGDFTYNGQFTGANLTVTSGHFRMGDSSTFTSATVTEVTGGELYLAGTCSNMTIHLGASDSTTELLQWRGDAEIAVLYGKGKVVVNYNYNTLTISGQATTDQVFEGNVCSGGSGTVKLTGRMYLGNEASFGNTVEVTGTLAMQDSEGSPISATVGTLHVGTAGQVQIGTNATLKVKALGGVDEGYGSIGGDGTLNLTAASGIFGGTISSNFTYAGSGRYDLTAAYAGNSLTVTSGTLRLSEGNSTAMTLSGDGILSLAGGKTLKLAGGSNRVGKLELEETGTVDLADGTLTTRLSGSGTLELTTSLETGTATLEVSGAEGSGIVVNLQDEHVALRVGASGATLRGVTGSGSISGDDALTLVGSESADATKIFSGTVGVDVNLQSGHWTLGAGATLNEALTLGGGQGANVAVVDVTGKLTLGQGSLVGGSGELDISLDGSAAEAAGGAIHLAEGVTDLTWEKGVRIVLAHADLITQDNYQTWEYQLFGSLENLSDFEAFATAVKGALGDVSLGENFFYQLDATGKLTIQELEGKWRTWIGDASAEGGWDGTWKASTEADSQWIGSPQGGSVHFAEGDRARFDKAEGGDVTIEGEVLTHQVQVKQGDWVWTLSSQEGKTGSLHVHEAFDIQGGSVTIEESDKYNFQGGVSVESVGELVVKKSASGASMTFGDGKGVSGEGSLKLLLSSDEASVSDALGNLLAEGGSLGALKFASADTTEHTVTVASEDGNKLGQLGALHVGSNVTLALGADLTKVEGKSPTVRLEGGSLNMGGHSLDLDLALDANANIAAGGNGRFTGVMTLGTNTLTVASGNLTLGGAVAVSAESGGKIAVADGATLTLSSNDDVLSQVEVDLTGTSSGGTLSVDSTRNGGYTIEKLTTGNHGTLDLKDSAKLTIQTMDGTLTRLTMGDGSALMVQSTLTVGAVTMAGGASISGDLHATTLTLNGTGSTVNVDGNLEADDFTMGSNAVSITGNLTAGSLALGNGAVLSAGADGSGNLTANTVTMAGGASISGNLNTTTLTLNGTGSTVNVDGNLEADDFTMGSNTVSITGNLSITGTWSWAAGSALKLGGQNARITLGEGMKIQPTGEAKLTIDLTSDLLGDRETKGSYQLFDGMQAGWQNFFTFTVDGEVVGGVDNYENLTLNEQGDLTWGSIAPRDTLYWGANASDKQGVLGGAGVGEWSHEEGAPGTEMWANNKHVHLQHEEPDEVSVKVASGGATVGDLHVSGGATYVMEAENGTPCTVTVKSAFTNHVTVIVGANVTVEATRYTGTGSLKLGGGNVTVQTASTVNRAEVAAGTLTLADGSTITELSGTPGAGQKALVTSTGAVTVSRGSYGGALDVKGLAVVGNFTYGGQNGNAGALKVSGALNLVGSLIADSLNGNGSIIGNGKLDLRATGESRFSGNVGVDLHFSGTGSLELAGQYTGKNVTVNGGGVLTLAQGATLDSLHLENGGMLTLSGGTLKASSVTVGQTGGGLAIGMTDKADNLEFGRLEGGKLTITLNGYDDWAKNHADDLTYQLFNEGSFASLWDALTQGRNGDEDWWKDYFDFHLDSSDSRNKVTGLDSAGKLTFGVYKPEGTVWTGSGEGEDANVWSTPEEHEEGKTDDNWGGNATPTAGATVTFKNPDEGELVGNGEVKLDKDVKAEEVYVDSGEFTFTGKNGNGSDSLTTDKLTVGGKGDQADLNLDTHLKGEEGTVVDLRDKGSLNVKENASLDEKTSIQFNGGALKFTSDSSEEDIASKVDAGNSSDKVKVNVEKDAKGATWTDESGLSSGGVSLALETGIEKTGEGEFTLSWQGTEQRHKGEITVDGGTLTLDVQDGEATMGGAVSGEGVLKAGAGEVRLAGEVKGFSGTLHTGDKKDGGGITLTEAAASGIVKADVSGNSTLDVESANGVTLTGQLGNEKDQLTVKNSGEGDLVIAGSVGSNTELNTDNEKEGVIVLGDGRQDGKVDMSFYEKKVSGTGDLVLSNVELSKDFNNGEAKLYVDTALAVTEESDQPASYARRRARRATRGAENDYAGGTVDMGGMDVTNKLSGITVNADGLLTGVTGGYTTGEKHNLRLHFTSSNWSKSPEEAGKALIVGGETQDGEGVSPAPETSAFTIDTEKSDYVSFEFDSSIFGAFRLDESGHDAEIYLHLADNVMWKWSEEQQGEKAEDWWNRFLFGSVTGVEYLNATEDGAQEGQVIVKLTGCTQDLYIVMNGEGGDESTSDRAEQLYGKKATVLLDGKTLTLNWAGDESGEEGPHKVPAIVHNLLGTEETTLDIRNSTREDDPESRLNVSLDNTLAEDIYDPRHDESDLPQPDKTTVHGQDTAFLGSIKGGEGIDVTKVGKGTLTVGGNYTLQDGETRLEEGGLVLWGEENRMTKMTFACSGAQDEQNGEALRGVKLVGGTTTVSEKLSDGEGGGELILEDGAELVLNGEDNELTHTNITGDGTGTIILDTGEERGKSASLALGGNASIRDVGMDLNKNTTFNAGSSQSRLSALNGSGTVTIGSGGALTVESGTFSGTLGVESDGSGEAATFAVAQGKSFTFDNIKTSGDKADERVTIEIGDNATLNMDLTRTGGSDDATVRFGDINVGNGRMLLDVGAQNTANVEGVLNFGEQGTLVLKSATTQNGEFTTKLTSGLDLDVLREHVQLTGVGFLLSEVGHITKKGDDGYITVTTEEATQNKFERALPGSTKNPLAGAKMMWDSLKSIQQWEAFVNALNHPDSDYDRLVLDLTSKMDNGQTNELERSLAAVAGSSLATLGPAFAEDLHRQLKNVRNRTTSMDASAGQAEIHGQLPMHMWINGEGSYHRMDDDGYFSGYTLNSWGGSIGVDVDVSKQTTLGFAVTAMYGDLKTDSADVGRGNLDTTYLSAFMRAASGSWIHTFVLTGGLADVQMNRTVNYGSGSYATQGSTDGYALGALYEVGYTRLLNAEGTIALQPVMNVEFRHVGIKGYTETGSNAALRVDDMEQNILTLGLGARMQSVVGENAFNRASIFEARVLLKADAGDQSGTAKAGIIGSTAMAEIESAEVGSIGVEAGAGITIPLGAKYGSVFLDASLEYRRGWTSVNASAGYRINF